MTDMEQGLRYIERELRYMIKDSFGNDSYTEYADRVIEDVCGIPKFCTTVLSSKRPLSVILRVVRGRRGDAIMRFFNASLHDARIEMVMVLAEALKLKSFKDNSAREAHNYLSKLYKKAVKRAVGLVSGSKTKESYKSMYRSLKNFVRVEDYDDDDDFDDDGDFEFHSSAYSDFVEDTLEAYRNGTEPPVYQPQSSAHIPSKEFRLPGNEQIIEEINSLELKLGRHLTNEEITSLILRESDLDDEDDDDLKFTDDDSDQEERMIRQLGEFVNLAKAEIIKSLAEMNALTPEALSKLTMENEKSSIVDAKEVSTDELEQAVNFTNKIRTGSTDGNVNPKMELIDSHHTSIDEYSDDEDYSDSEESSELAPDTMSGANNVIEVTNVKKEVSQSNLADELKELNVVPISDLGFQHSMIISEAIKDVNITHEKLVKRLSEYFTHCGLSLTDCFIALSSSNTKNTLLTLRSYIKIAGDYEVLDMSFVNTMIYVYTKELAKSIGVDEDLIDTDIRINSSDITNESDLESEDLVSEEMLFNIVQYSAFLSVYLYKKTEKIYEVRYIRDDKDITYFITDYSTENAESEIIEVDEMGYIASMAEPSFRLNDNTAYNIEYKILKGSDELAMSSFINKLKEICSDIDIFTGVNIGAIKQLNNSLEFYDIPLTEDISVKMDLANNYNSVIYDIIYTLSIAEHLSEEASESIDELFTWEGSFNIRPMLIAMTLSSNIDINSYCKSNVFADDTVVEDVV